MSVKSTKPEHEIAYQDLCTLMKKHADKLSSLELLAIGANMIGKMIAMQDQRRVTPAEAMKIVAENIEYGNQQVLEILATQSEGKA